MDTLSIWQPGRQIQIPLSIRTDGNGCIDTATVTITITGVNDSPTAADNTDETNEDNPVTTGNVLINDSDPDVSDTLFIESTDTSGTQGIVTDHGDGTFTYDPNGQFEYLAVGETTTDTFSYTVTDGHGGTDTATVTITITGVNDAPEAVDDLANAGNSDAGDGHSIDTTIAPELGTNDVGAKGVVPAKGKWPFIHDPKDPSEYPEAEGPLANISAHTLTYVNGGIDPAAVPIAIIGVNEGKVAFDDTDTASMNKDSIVTKGSGADSAPDTNDNLNDESIDTADVLSYVAGNTYNTLTTICRLILVICCLATKQFHP